MNVGQRDLDQAGKVTGRRQAPCASIEIGSILAAFGGIVAGAAAAGLLWVLLERIASTSAVGAGGTAGSSGLSSAVFRYTGAIIAASGFAGVFGGMAAAAVARYSSAAASCSIGAISAAALAAACAIATRALPGIAAFATLGSLALPLAVCGLVGGGLAHFLIVVPGRNS